MDKEMSTSEEKEGEMGIPFFMKIWIDSQQYCSTTDDFIVMLPSTAVILQRSTPGSKRV
jgi:hypothetical protein